MPYTTKKNLKTQVQRFVENFANGKVNVKKKYHNRNVYVMHFTVVRETYFV